MALKKPFFDSLLTRDLEKSLQGYDGPFLTINGDDDPYLKYAPALVAAAGGADSRAVTITGSDHIFNVYRLSESKVADLIGLTVDRFIQTLTAD